jgi:hypothetical protein
MSLRSQLVICLGIWGVAIVILAYHNWKRKIPTSGLSLAYLASFALIHWFGALLYVLPWYSPESAIIIHSGASLETTSLGFIQSTIGIIGFVIGTVIVAPLLLNSYLKTSLPGCMYHPNFKLPRQCLVLGAIFYFVLQPILGSIPSISSVVSTGLSLATIGLCLGCWQAWHFRPATLSRWLAVALIAPTITVVRSGFLGYGTTIVIIVAIFVFTFYKPRWKVVVAFVLSIFLGLSVFVNYLQDRDEIRASVWGGEDIGGRIVTLTDTFSKFEMFDLTNQQHLEAIDGRLNQNTLVGQAVEYLGSGQVRFAQGQTLALAAVSWIPRILWPGKPAVGGSGDLVSLFTGRVFTEGTSVGVGQVLEFYINFGSIGVFIGFLVFGAIVQSFDMLAGRKLVSNDWVSFIVWFLPGLGFIQPGGSLVEVVATVASSIILGYILRKFVLRPSVPVVYHGFQYHPSNLLR